MPLGYRTSALATSCLSNASAGTQKRLTAAVLSQAGVGPGEKVQYLGSRMRCRECDKKGRAVISIRWGTKRPGDAPLTSTGRVRAGRDWEE